MYQCSLYSGRKQRADYQLFQQIASLFLVVQSDFIWMQKKAHSFLFYSPRHCICWIFLPDCSKYAPKLFKTIPARMCCTFVRLDEIGKIRLMLAYKILLGPCNWKKNSNFSLSLEERFTTACLFVDQSPRFFLLIRGWLFSLLGFCQNLGGLQKARWSNRPYHGLQGVWSWK